MSVFVELSEDLKRIEIWFPFDREVIAKLKSQISGPRFVQKDKSYNGQAHWTVPADIECCRELRRTFGKDLEIGKGLWSWAQQTVTYERNLKSLASASTAELPVLRQALPKLYEAIHLGPLGRWMTPAERAQALAQQASFQAADVAFMAHADNPLNGNHPGLGKTLESIAAIYEAGLGDGPVLVVAPKSSLVATWSTELQEWQQSPVYVSTGSRKDKDGVLAAFEREVLATAKPGWLVVNPDQVRYREQIEVCEYHLGRGTSNKLKAEMRRCTDCEVKLVSEFPMLHGTKWNAVVIDECHKGAVRNPKTLTAKGMFGLRVAEGGKRMALTGTPMGGKIINLWGVLHFLNPKLFTSKWRWAEMWTDVASNEFFTPGGRGAKSTSRTIGSSIKHCEAHFGWDDEAAGKRPDCAGCAVVEEAFYGMLAPYMTRRTKAEALPWLPPKQFVPLWVDFGSAAHRKQYEEFNTESQTVIDGLPLTSVNVLSEYTRLKQFAFSRHERRDGKLVPTVDSGKLEVVREKLEELGIWDGEGTEQAIIFSQFSQVVDLVHGWLLENGIKASKITGAVGKRDEIKRDFQSGQGARVCVITTTAGGVSITLDAASNVFMLDETWVPDDQEQAEDRAHRASRIHQVTVYYLRTIGTIEESICETNGTKRSRNGRVLDVHRLRELAQVRR